MLYKSKVCPHCKCQFSLLQLLYLKDKSHFQCFNCKKNCAIILNSGIKVLFTLIAVFSVLIMASFIFLIKKLLVGTFLLTTLFIVFYAFVPVFLYVKPASGAAEAN